MSFGTITHITCNEVGREEVSFEVERTFLQCLLRRPAVTKAFELWPIGWRCKATGQIATPEERADISMAKAQCDFVPWERRYE